MESELDPEAVMTRQEAAAALGVTERTVQTLLKHGDLTKIRVGKRGVRVTIESVEREKALRARFELADKTEAAA